MSTSNALTEAERAEAFTSISHDARCAIDAVQDLLKTLAHNPAVGDQFTDDAVDIESALEKIERLAREAAIRAIAATRAIRPTDRLNIDDLTEADVGRRVLYCPHPHFISGHQAQECGVITTWNNGRVFVKFNAAAEYGTACHPADLKWDDSPSQPEISL